MEGKEASIGAIERARKLSRENKHVGVEARVHVARARELRLHFAALCRTASRIEMMSGSILSTGLRPIELRVLVASEGRAVRGSAPIQQIGDDHARLSETAKAPREQP
jgi:hypothetical protein